jgi:hypothetical protein
MLKATRFYAADFLDTEKKQAAYKPREGPRRNSSDLA